MIADFSRVHNPDKADTMEKFLMYLHTGKNCVQLDGLIQKQSNAFPIFTEKA